MRCLAVVLLAGLSLPCAHLAVAQREAANSSTPLSPAFSQAGIAALADIHRWKLKARHDAEGREPAPSFGAYLKVSAQESVSQAKLHAKTEGDHHSTVALDALLAKMSAWTDRLIAARRRLDATHMMNPESLDTDEELASISACEKALHRMLISRSYSDLPQCR